MYGLQNDISDSVFTGEHRMLRDETRKFVENEVLPEVRERDPKSERMSDDLVRWLAEMGFFGILIGLVIGGE